MKIRFGAATDVGITRDHNEDNFLVDKNLQLFIVCDGMGGHAAGEVASAMTVNIVRDDIARNRDLLRSFEEGDERVGRRDILALLEHAVQHACYQVYERAQQNPEHRGMGTTCVVALIAGNRGFIAHVGDSRIYLLRQDQVHQLTEDHSLINELLKQGRIHQGAGVPTRYKNAVTRAVGVYESVEVDTLDFDILPGDRYLLCTDGLHGYLTNERVLRLMEDDEDDQAVVDRMVRFANEKGGRDNITAIVVAVPEAQPDVRHERVRRKLATLKGLALFKYLNYQELVKVVNIAIERTFAKGEVIIREGDRDDCLYVILTGSVAIVKQEVEVARLSDGTHFGEMSLVDKSPRSADAVAVTDVQTLIISRRSFYDVLRKNPSLAVKLLWSFLKVMSTRLRSTNDELTVIKSTGVGSRASSLTDDTGDIEILPATWLDPEDLADSSGDHLTALPRSFLRTATPPGPPATSARPVTPAPPASAAPTSSRPVPPPADEAPPALPDEKPAAPRPAVAPSESAAVPPEPTPVPPEPAAVPGDRTSPSVFAWSDEADDEGADEKGGSAPARPHVVRDTIPQMPAFADIVTDELPPDLPASPPTPRDDSDDTVPELPRLTTAAAVALTQASPSPAGSAPARDNGEEVRR
jgi:serine/threonine protein phosphatase PrpC/CRP-like cAMP-binding protein